MVVMCDVSIPPMSRYELYTQGALEPHVSREWLLTDGAGGFSMGTSVGINTRRYHGLFIPATQAPLGRAVLLGRVAETIITAGGRFELSGNYFGQSVHPEGHKYLQRFMTEGDTAQWFYSVPGAKVTKTLKLTADGARLSYEVVSTGAESLGLLVQAFTPMRDYHHLGHAGNRAPLHFEQSGQSITVYRDSYTLRMTPSAGSFTPRPDWWFGHTYPIDTERGQEDQEDTFTPGVWEVAGPGPLQWELAVTAPTVKRPEAVSGGLYTTALASKKTYGPKASALLSSAQAYLALRPRPDGKAGVTVLAGFPWFGDWGRDTFISMPGLMLTTGRTDLAFNVLATFAQFVSEGMIPNRFSDNGLDIEYNTVDASLWFIHAAHAYLEAGGDKAAFTKSLLPACKAIIDGYRAGTRYGIYMDPADSLIRQGDEHTQLTWMDAKYEGVAFTPRAGKPVEINALWYHALCLLEEKSLAGEVKEGFAKFVRPDGLGLYDTILDDGTPDAKIRPNQIFAVSLEHSALTPKQQKAVVDVVKRELLTPHGLRSLSPADPGYRGRYTGPQSQRDAAYHNGTVWGWLIGPFVEAYLRSEKESAASMKQAQQWLLPLFDHLTHEGLFGQVAEIFDGDTPHRPVGCPAQAWSVAELLRMAAKVGM